jgi:hypothetical protein
MEVHMTATRYPFHFDRRYQVGLTALGVLPATAWVDVDEERIFARFGPWSCATTTDNVIDVCESGPYLAVRAIGARLSSTDRGLTFGTTTRGGVCLLLREPITGLDPLGKIKHPGVTLTVADTEGFAAHVRRVAGLAD